MVAVCVGFGGVSMVNQPADSGARIYEIGDGSKVSNVLTCVRDAFEVIRNL